MLERFPRNFHPALLFFYCSYLRCNLTPLRTSLSINLTPLRSSLRSNLTLLPRSALNYATILPRCAFVSAPILPRSALPSAPILPRSALHSTPIWPRSAVHLPPASRALCLMNTVLTAAGGAFSPNLLRSLFLNYLAAFYMWIRDLCLNYSDLFKDIFEKVLVL